MQFIVLLLSCLNIIWFFVTGIDVFLSRFLVCFSSFRYCFDYCLSSIWLRFCGFFIPEVDILCRLLSLFVEVLFVVLHLSFRCAFFDCVISYVWCLFIIGLFGAITFSFRSVFIDFVFLRLLPAIFWSVLISKFICNLLVLPYIVAKVAYSRTYSVGFFVCDSILPFSILFLSSVKVIPGFDTPNIDIRKRKREFQDIVNNNVMSKQIRVLFMPNKDNLPLKDIVKIFLEKVVKYDVKEDFFPLSWVKKGGFVGDTICFRAEMTSSFWDHFISKGRLNLANYNKEHKCDVKVVRNQSLMKSDVENLGLFLRQKLREICKQKKVPSPEILVRGAYVLIKSRKFKNTMRFKSPVLAILLGLDYREWNGSPIKSLLSSMDLLGYEKGAIQWGSLKLEKLLSLEPEGEELLETSELPNEESRSQSRKREMIQSEELSNKKPRSDGGE